MNIEIMDSRQPTLEQARHLGSIRFVPKWQVWRGETFDTAANRAAALVNRYAANGVPTILCMTHEIGAELAENGWNWQAMTSAEWTRFRLFYCDLLERWAARLGGNNLIYQIMNEVDSQDNRASVVVPPAEYGAIYRAAHATIKRIAPAARVITAGYNSGPTRGMHQFLSANIQTTDGVAFHPYGASAGGWFAHAGIPAIDQQVAAWRGLARPLYITEYGVLGRPGADEQHIAAYAMEFINRTRTATVLACWYDWLGGDAGQWSGYGVMTRDGRLRTTLYNALRRNGAGQIPEPGLTNATETLVTVAGAVNFRAGASLKAPVIGRISTGTRLLVSNVTPRPENDGYVWYHAELNARVGYFASVPGLQLWRLWQT